MPATRDADENSEVLKPANSVRLTPADPQLGTLEAYFSALFARHRDAVTLYDATGLLAVQNDAAVRLRSICHWDDVLQGPNARSAFSEAFKGEHSTFEAMVRSTEGDLNIRVDLAPIVIDDEVYGVSEIARDLLVSVSPENEFDPTTGLPNLVILYDRMTRLLMHSRRDNRPFALHMFAVSVEAGASPGVMAEVQRLAVDRLTASVRSVDTVARMGRSFVVVQPDVVEREGAMTLAARLVTQLGMPFTFEGGLHRVNVHSGISVSDRRTPSIDDMLAEADLALARQRMPRGIRSSKRVQRP